MTRILFVLSLLVLPQMGLAQKELVQFLQMPECSEVLMEKYLEPLAKMQNGNLNAGWYHSARPHRFLGFDFSVSMATTSMGGVKKGFYVDRLADFDDHYIVKESSTPITPSVAGKTNDLAVIKQLGTADEITLPNGSGLDKIALPMVSLGVGLPYNTELRFNYMPALDKDKIGKTTKYGASVKHSIKEYIPGLQDIPVLSLSLMGGYSLMKNEIDVVYPSADPLGQVLEGEIKGFTGRVLVGMDMRVFSAYAGLGYGSATVDYALKGKYYVGNVDHAVQEVNPLAVSYEYSQVDINLGINAKLAFLDVFADYSIGEYKTFNIGVGYSFR